MLGMIDSKTDTKASAQAATVADIKTAAQQKVLALLDVDKTLLAPDTDNPKTWAIFDAIPDALIKASITNVYLFTNMADASQVLHCNDPGNSLSKISEFGGKAPNKKNREQLIKHLQAKGLTVHGVITPYDNVHEDGASGVYEKVFKPIIENFSDEKLGVDTTKRVNGCDLWDTLSDVLLPQLEKYQKTQFISHFKRFFVSPAVKDHKALDTFFDNNSEDFYHAYRESIDRLDIDSTKHGIKLANLKKKIPSELNGLGEDLSACFKKYRHFENNKGFMAELAFELAVKKGYQRVICFDDNKDMLDTPEQVFKKGNDKNPDAPIFFKAILADTLYNVEHYLGRITRFLQPSLPAKATAALPAAVRTSPIHLKSVNVEVGRVPERKSTTAPVKQNRCCPY